MRRERVDVLHIIGAWMAGGAEKFVGDLLLALKRDGLSVGGLALSSKTDAVGERMMSQLDGAGVPYSFGPTAKVGLRSVAWTIREINSIRPRIIHLHTENTELAYFLSRPFCRRGHRVVRTLHTVNRSTNRLHWWAINGNPVDVSVACGPAVLERFVEEVKGRVIAIPNGIDFHWPIQTPARKEACKRMLGLTPGCFDFVHIGNMKGASITTAAKAHDVLIRAWRETGLGECGGRLHLIGDGNLRSELELLAQGDGSIVFHGIRADSHGWLLAADCFVMPSRYEGLPIAGIEAVGTGLPCILSDIKPLMGFDEPGVLRVKQDDPQDLASKLTEAFKSVVAPPTGTIARFRERYGIARTATDYRCVYESIAQSATGTLQPRLAP